MRSICPAWNEKRSIHGHRIPQWWVCVAITAKAIHTTSQWTSMTFLYILTVCISSDLFAQLQVPQCPPVERMAFFCPTERPTPVKPFVRTATRPAPKGLRNWKHFASMCQRSLPHRLYRIVWSLALKSLRRHSASSAVLGPSQFHRVSLLKGLVAVVEGTVMVWGKYIRSERKKLQRMAVNCC